MRLPVLLLTILTLAIAAKAQTIEVTNLRSESGQIKFDFRLTQDFSDRERYTVKIYTNHDNYTKPLSEKYDNVIPGTVYPVAFNGAFELKGFSGNLKLKLEAEASVYPVQIVDVSKLKRGKDFSISWKTISDGPFTIDLIDDNGSVTTLASNVASNSYEGTIPKSVEKGKDYQVIVTPRNSPGERSDPEAVSVTSGSIIIPLVAVPVVAAGAAGAVVLGGGGGGGGNGNGNNLPGPPNLPE